MSNKKHNHDDSLPNQTKRYNRKAGEEIANKYLKYLNGEDDSMEFLDSWAKQIDAGEDTKKIYEEAELVLDGKLFDLLGGQDAVDKELKKFKSELDGLNNHSGKSEHKNKTNGATKSNGNHFVYSKTPADKVGFGAGETVHRWGDKK